ncbi:MAG: tetraacyldisaccharide 4'-kinase [Pseudomonadota bacterium]
MQQPKFWGTAPGLTATLLGPAAALYGLGGRVRHALVNPTKADVPVICIGNLIAGGAGKTPLALAVAARLVARGIAPHFLSRGYRGSIRETHRVDPTRDTAAEVGDEPLLLAAQYPTWTGRDRAASAAAAVAAGAEALVMDDGFQNPSLVKDLSLIAIDAGFGHGNGRVIPAGPLREPLMRGFERADAAVLIGEPAPATAWPFVPEGIPLLQARITPRFTGLSLTGAPVLAFAGIGRPEKFFETLRRMGARLVDTQAFPDHHTYSMVILARLEARAHSQGAMLVTTEKDAVRLPRSFQGRAIAVPVSLGFEDPDALDTLLDTLFPREANTAVAQP